MDKFCEISSARNSFLAGETGILIEPDSKRLEFLDAVRGVAALWVMLFHLRNALLRDIGTTVPDWVYPIGYGAMGVDLFYVASAFSLFFSMHRRNDKTALKFYIRRFFRIAPLFYIMVILLFCFENRWKNLDLLVSMTLLFNAVPGFEDSVILVGWSVGVEMFFYLIFPTVFRHVKSFGRAIVALIVSSILLWPVDQLLEYIHTNFSIESSAQYPPFYLIFFVRYLAVFFSGIVAFHAGYLISKSRYPFLSGAGILLLGFALLNIFFYYWKGVGLIELARIHNRGALIEKGIIFGLLLVGLMNAPVSVIVNAFTRFLGKISYSIYLLHLPIITLLVPLFRLVVTSGLSLGCQFAACSIILMATVLPLSYLSFLLIERPGIRLGERLISRKRFTVASATIPPPVYGSR